MLKLDQGKSNILWMQALLNNLFFAPYRQNIKGFDSSVFSELFNNAMDAYNRLTKSIHVDYL